MTDGSAGGFRSHSSWIGRFVCAVVVVITVSAWVVGLASAQTNLPAGNVGQTVPTAPNHALTAGCGLDVSLVLDESLSIAQTSGATLATQNAAKAFVSALTGTGSRLLLTAFSIGARNGPFPTFTTLTDDNAAIFNSWIGSGGNAGATQGGSAGFNPAGPNTAGTNWDAGLRSSQPASGTHPALVVFVTDGEPNTHVLPGGGNSTPTTSPNATSLNNAVTTSNMIVKPNSHVFVVGVGPAATGGFNGDPGRRIRAISGENQFPAHANFNTADFTLVTSFTGLEAEMRKVVSEICGGSLTVTKEVLDHNGQLIPNSPHANGWGFETTLTSGGHTWTQPPNRGTASTATVTTGQNGEPDGIARFAWDLHAGVSHVVASVREIARPHIEFTSVGAQCETQHLTGPPTVTGPTGITLRADDIGTCTFVNELHPARLTVEKSLEPSDDPGRFHLHIEGVQTGPVGDNGRLTETVPSGNVNFGETGAIQEDGTTLTDLAHYDSSISCFELTSGAAVHPVENTGTSGVVHLNPGQDVVCTITNTSNQFGEITVIKHLIPEDDPGRFHLQITPGSHVSGAVGDGGRLGPVDLRFGTYHVTETGANGTDLGHYDISTTCTNESTGHEVGHNANGPDVSVDLSEAANNIECVITNHRPPVKTGHLKVVKHLVPNGDAGTFNLLIGGTAFAVDVGHNGTTGSLEFELGTHPVTEQGAEGTTLAEFETSTTCVDHAGHTVAHNGHGPSVSVHLTEGANIVCTITNKRITPPPGGGEEITPPPGPAPHLSVVKILRARASVGELVPIMVTVHNFGHGTAHGVQLVENRPPGLQIVHVANGGTIQHGNAVWHLGNLAPGESRTVHATARVLHTGLHIDTAVATALNADPALSNAFLRARAVPRPPRPPTPPPPVVTG